MERSPAGGPLGPQRGWASQASFASLARLCEHLLYFRQTEDTGYLLKHHALGSAH